MPVVKMLRGGRALVDGKRGDALTSWKDAAPALDRVGLKLHAAVTRRAMGVVLDGQDGDRLVSEAEAWLGARGVRRVDPFCAAFLPSSTA
jgi:hypothetical protein